MQAVEQLRTKRLLLRRWKPGDIENFAAINADPQVMEYFPKPYSFEETVRMVEKIESCFEREGFGLWAVEVAELGKFIGYVGLSRPTFKAPFTPCVEIGWRIARDHWGKGFASEAARQVLKDGFERIQLNEIVSFTALSNWRSIRVMERIGMLRDLENDFQHPLIEDGHRLKAHALFRLTKLIWQSSSV